MNCANFAPMKILVYILTIYLLGLNFLPCNDTIPLEKDTEITQVHADQGQQYQDWCSPFCQCHCCHAHVIEMGSTSFEVSSPVISKQQFFYFDDKGWDIYKSFLQPPQV